MDKTLSQLQVKTIIDNAPKGTDPKEIVNGLVSRGYTLQGLNDQQQAPKAPEPTSGVTNQGIQDAHGQAKAAIGGAAQLGLGASLPLSAIDFAGRKIVNAVGTDQMKQNLENTPSLNEQFSKTFGMDEYPTAAAVGAAAGTVGSLVPFAAEQGAKLLATEKGQQVVENVGKAVNTIKQAGQSALENISSNLPVAENANATTNFIQDLVSPKATEAVKNVALQQGRVVEPGILSPGKILPSTRDTQLAEAVKPFVSESASPVENLNSISQGVQDINNGVKSYVAENKVPFNTNQLKSQLNKGKDELNLIFASDSNAEKTYNAVVKEFVKHVDSKDTAGLLDARQEFDKIPAIKKLLDSQGLGENTKKEVVLTVRDMANRYIASLLPEGNTYRSALQQESKMIEAIGNIADKNTGIIGTNKLEMITKKYPILKWIAGTAVGAGGVGVGGALINSTD